MKREQTVRSYAARVALCVALSLVVHGVVVGLLLWWVQSQGAGGRGMRAGGAEDPGARSRALQIVTRAPHEEEKPRPFAKTNPDDEESAAPKDAEFVGKRNAVASSSPEAPERRSEEALPTQEGEEREDLVTFDQERQEGALEHDGKEAAPQESTAAAGIPIPPVMTEGTENQAEDQEQESAVSGSASILSTPTEAEGDVLLREAQEEPEGAVAAQKPQAAVRPAIRLPRLPPGMAGAVFDPALAEHMQPRPAGFRTHERRTRSTGRFVIGSKPSLSVASTPQGRYEEEVYRRIAYFWYIACDDHRGDIIPGSVVISLRINSHGRLVNMDLVRRTGASMSQQSFTFGAIRRATLPPMPPAVQQEIVGDLLELIFQFNFD